MKPKRIAELREILNSGFQLSGNEQLECLNEIERLQTFDGQVEREKFEREIKWLTDFRRDEEGEYQNIATENAWQSWLASAKSAKGITT